MVGNTTACIFSSVESLASSTTRGGGYVSTQGATLLTGGCRPPHMPKGYYLLPVRTAPVPALQNTVAEVVKVTQRSSRRADTERLQPAPAWG